MRKDYQQYRVTATPAQTMRFYPDNRRVNSINFNLGTQKQASSRVHRLALAKPRVLVLARQRRRGPCQNGRHAATVSKPSSATLLAAASWWAWSQWGCLAGVAAGEQVKNLRGLPACRKAAVGLPRLRVRGTSVVPNGKMSSPLSSRNLQHIRPRRPQRAEVGAPPPPPAPRPSYLAPARRGAQKRPSIQRLCQAGLRPCPVAGFDKGKLPRLWRRVEPLTFATLDGRGWQPHLPDTIFGPGAQAGQPRRRPVQLGAALLGCAESVCQQAPSCTHACWRCASSRL